MTDMIAAMVFPIADVSLRYDSRESFSMSGIHNFALDCIQA